MKRLIAACLIAVVSTMLLVSAGLAQDDATDDDDSFILKVNGSTTVPVGETVNAALIINGDIMVDGTITDTLIVVEGTATINGTVGGDVTVVSGDLVLAAGSTVEDVQLISSNVQNNGGTVNGEIEERDGDFSLGRGFAIFSLLWWVGLLILGVAAAIIFAWLGRAQLFGAVETLRSRFVPSLITALIVFIALPILAILIVFTLVGAPLGISIILVLLPVLLLLGIVIVGTWIASYIIKSNTTGGAIGTAVLGVIIVALVSLIPFVAVVVALAGMLGAGALVYRSFDRARSRTVPQAV